MGVARRAGRVFRRIGFGWLGFAVELLDFALQQQMLVIQQALGKPRSGPAEG